MNSQWAVASLEASRPMKWYDLVTIAAIVAGAALAAIGWLVFDGRRAL